MSYFLAPVALTRGQTLTLSGEEAAHLLKSRRLRAGDQFALQGTDGGRFQAEVVQVGRHDAVVRTLEPLTVPALPPLRLTLLLAAVKEKALELVLQKATELGAAEIVVFPAEHSPVAHAELAAPKAVARWQRILMEACKQCDRQFPPLLHVAPGLEGALGHAAQAPLRLALDPRAEATLPACLSAAGSALAAALLIGPEGGLTPDEVAQSEHAGFTPVALGGLILRTETAAIAMAAVLLLGR